MTSKKELIALYNDHKLKDIGYHALTTYNSIIIIEANEDYVFGYHQFLNEPKQFFKRRLYHLEEASYFLVDTHTFYLHEFIRF